MGTAEVRKRWLEVMELATKKDKTLPEKKRLEWLLAELMEGYSAVSYCKLEANLDLTGPILADHSPAPKDR